MPLIIVKILNGFGPIPAGFTLLFLCPFLRLLLATALYRPRLTLGSKGAVNDRNDCVAVTSAGIAGVNVKRNHRIVPRHLQNSLSGE